MNGLRVARSDLEGLRYVDSDPVSSDRWLHYISADLSLTDHDRFRTNRVSAKLANEGRANHQIALSGVTLLGDKGSHGPSRSAGHKSEERSGKCLTALSSRCEMKRLASSCEALSA